MGGKRRAKQERRKRRHGAPSHAVRSYPTGGGVGLVLIAWACTDPRCIADHDEHLVELESDDR